MEATFPSWALAAFWGFVSGSALLIGAAIGYVAKMGQKTVAGIMAFGSGVLISALTLELMNNAYERGGFVATSVGFLGGAAVYTAANWYLDTRGAKNRKRSGRSALYIFGVWLAICLASAGAAAIGNAVFGGFSASVTSATTAVAAGAMLAMLADTMVPEAFENAHELSGLITVAGFLASFILSKLGG